MTEPERRTLGDRYELQTLLATGGMGQVWRARDRLLDRAVAVKVLRSEYTGDPTFLARFRAEAHHTARLLHPGIAALHDYGEVVSGEGETLAYLVMELVEGEPLSALLAREGRLGPERTLDVVGQAAAALAVAHAAGVVHRDVKPGNLLVDADGGVKVTDFGIAWSASSVPLTRTGQVVGTAHYLSPEQAAGGRAGPASDVYALGVIAYECLAGRRPFDGENPVQIALMQIRDEPDPLPGDVPGPLRTLVATALVKDPVARFRDGAAVRDAVADVRAGRALPPPPTAPLTLAGSVPVPRRRRLLVPVAALLAGAGIGIAALQVARDDGTAVVAAPPAAAAVPASESVLVAAADHLGRPVDEVEAALAALGLRVERVTQERGDVPAGQVTALGPVGALAPGDLVTLTVAAAPPPEPVVEERVVVETVVPPVAQQPAPAPLAVDVVDEAGRSDDASDDSRDDASDDSEDDSGGDRSDSDDSSDDDGSAADDGSEDGDSGNGNGNSGSGNSGSGNSGSGNGNSGNGNSENGRGNGRG